MRTTYVYDPLLRKMIRKPIESAIPIHDIMPDLPDFVSSVDRRIIHGRAGLRRHNKELGVTNPADYTNYWADFQKKREALFRGEAADKKRTEAVARAFNELQYGERKPTRSENESG